VYDLLEENGLEDDVVLEDRTESAGFKMNEAAFVGFPYQIIIGKAMKSEGQVELQIRKTGEKKFLTKEQLVEFFKEKNAKLKI
jgi:prolyl-tRNA synthetase